MDVNFTSPTSSSPRPQPAWHASSLSLMLGGDGRTSSEGWSRGNCPVHGGVHQSLSLKLTRDSRLICKCWSVGCDPDAIRAAIDELLGTNFANPRAGERLGIPGPRPAHLGGVVEEHEVDDLLPLLPPYRAHRRPVACPGTASRSSSHRSRSSGRAKATPRISPAMQTPAPRKPSWWGWDYERRERHVRGIRYHHHQSPRRFRQHPFIQARRTGRDTGMPVSDGSACSMARGVAESVAAPDAGVLAGIINTLDCNQALTLGTMKVGVGVQRPVVTQAMLNKLPEAQRKITIARTRENIPYQCGKAGLDAGRLRSQRHAGCSCRGHSCRRRRMAGPVIRRSRAGSGGSGKPRQYLSRPPQHLDWGNVPRQRWRASLHWSRTAVTSTVPCGTWGDRCWLRGLAGSWSGPRGTCSSAALSTSWSVAANGCALKARPR